MKKISLFVLIGLFCMGIIHAQEAELKELLAAPNTQMSKETGKGSEKPLSSLLKVEGKSPRSNQLKSSIIIETNCVYHVVLGGYAFHVADYLDGTKIVTCLDGSLMGLQGISYNGVLQLESRNVQWNGSQFVHFYPGGKVISYPKRQISDLY